MPPQLALTNHGEMAGALVVDRLLVVAEMEETRLAEQLRDLGDQIGADPVVVRRRNHAVVFLEPRVVPCREVELGNEFYAHLRKTPLFPLQTFLAPGSLG